MGVEGEREGRGKRKREGMCVIGELKDEGEGEIF